MGRPRKEDKQQKETAELMISVEDFARTRDSRIHAPSMSASAFLPPAQARQVRAGLGDMSRQLRELISSIPLVLAQLRLYPDPQFFVQVVTGLTTLQTAVSDLLRSYLKHTNSVLGSTPYRLDTFGISNPLNNNEILAGALRDSPPAAAAGPAAAAAPQPIAAPVAAPAAPAEEEPVKKGRKPKKEKKEKDPNEPKRPLTMYFLYSAQARPIVKEDLGPTVTPGAVEEEIKKRWRELGDEEKKAWQEVYNKNRDEYLKKIAEYKANKGEAEAAKSLADAAEAAEADVEMAEGAATAAGATAEESSQSEEESSDKEASPKAPTPPVENKTPKPKRRKTGKENGVVAASSAAAPAHTASPIPLPSHPKNAVESTPAKPANTRKAAAKKEEAPKETVEEPAKRKRGRKSKGAEEVAAAAAEPAPEPEKKNKRKRKSEGATA
ncbi:high mobility group protein [Diplodia intermedia]|uniref:High mobility group protein n=1 Tax=Diplodia intermedia TaxID=856260 RepID=A0ABR3TV78_9PEZI